MKILIVDDKQENLYLLESLLQSAGYEIVSAKNGAEAFGMALNDSFGLIISDILMPIMDGFTFCRECRKNTYLKNVPFIFYTATYTDPKDEEFALSLGADRFIVKPQDPDIFIAAVKELMEGGQKKSMQFNASALLPEEVMLKEYNSTLIRKLEEKMRQTEENEKKLKNYVRELEENLRERIKTEKALRESEERYRLVQENSMDAILLTLSDGTILSANRAACDMFRMTEEELCRSGVQGIADVSDSRFTPMIEERNRTGKVTGEMIFIRKDTSKISAEISSSIYTNSSGEIRSSIIIREITERKKSDEKIHHQLNELQRWHEATVGREHRILELKQEVNALLMKYGEPIRYPSAADRGFSV
jgi:PAS domain S-box-containing protein